MKKKIPTISAETEIIYRMILSMPDPDKLTDPSTRTPLTYEEIARAVGLDVAHRVHWSYHIRSAVRKALSDGVGTRCETNVGLVRLTAEEYADEMRKRRDRSMTQNRQAKKFGDAISQKQWLAMTPEQRNRLNLERTLVSLGLELNKPRAVKRLAAEIEKTGMHLPAARGYLALEDTVRGGRNDKDS